jgi:hypothetical protein
MVDSDIILECPYSFEVEGYTYDFLIDNHKRFNCVSICSKADITKFKQHVTRGEDGIPHFTISSDLELQNKLIDKLQLLESNMSFNTMGGVTRFYWNNPREEFIPENDAEKKDLVMYSFQLTKEYKKPKIRIKNEKDSLERFVKYGDRYEELKIPKAFCREGLINHRNFQYVQAFYNYYFVIEDFYSKGKTSTKELLKEFMGSPGLAKYINSCLEKFGQDNLHGEKLRSLLDQEKLPFNTTGLLRLIIIMRGMLHHYHRRGTKLKGTPFNQKEFETIAVICNYIAVQAIAFREVEINQLYENNLEGPN